ncbi:hypothetical protein C0992_003719 [Termitomyces sp. T32_za158]|nr:hypothetical protein C0992_003719 [Termitomyces sp. T32_za158]
MSAQGSGSSTNDDDTAHKVPIGAIAGGAAGGVVLIFIVVLIFLLCRRRRRAHANPRSTVPDPKPQHPVLVPFTSSSPGRLDVETGTTEGMSPFTSIRKERDVQRIHGPQPHHSPSASLNSNSDLLGAQHQNMITEQINSLRKELEAFGSRMSGPHVTGGVSELLHEDQTMEAEIERLQLVEAPPVYPGYAHNTRRFTSSSTPVSVF